ncbi:MAG: hypothetical protein HUU15_06410 [Candidatus Brocadiae bacterium]|nr:hypothetical protein [Candidatus Brocadiia bacterium]
MPKDEMDETDPMQFVGMGVPAGPGADEDMVRAVVEEFMLLGFDRNRLLGLFRNSFYAGTHRIWRERGEAYVTDLLDKVLAEWTPASVAKSDI